MIGKDEGYKIITGMFKFPDSEMSKITWNTGYDTGRMDALEEVRDILKNEPEALKKLEDILKNEGL